VADYGLGLPHDIIPRDKLYDTGHCFYFAPELFRSLQTLQPSLDMWSFGMILYTLLTDKIPFSDEKDYRNVRKRITELKDVSIPLPTNTPKLLSKMISSCCKITPSERPRFKELAEENMWNQIYQEVALQGNDDACAIWRKAQKIYLKNELVLRNDEVDSLPWSLFSLKFWKAMDMEHQPENSEISRCIKSVMGVSNQVENPILKLTSFSKFIKVFSPFRSGEEGKDYVKSIVRLLKQIWYYGPINRDTAESIINMAKRKIERETNPFLVRISENQECKFCFVFFNPEKNTIEHCIVEPDTYAKEGFFSYIRTEVKKRKLTPCSINNTHHQNIFLVA